MIEKASKLPLYIKITVILIAIISLTFILYVAKNIVVPLVFATILAILLHPLVNFISKFKIHRVIAILISLLLSLIIIAGLIFLLVSQINRFSESLPSLADKLTILLNDSVTWLASYFDINSQKIYEWISSTKDDIINNNSIALGQILINFGSNLVLVLLIPVYVFLILFYQPLIVEFIKRLFTSKKNEAIVVVLQTKKVVQAYLIGLIIETVIIAVLEISALLILGIEYAVLLGILGALLNLIPYIGGIVAVAMPMIIALATKDSAWYALYILIIYYIIQLIDNNFIVPKIVASRVKINALFSIIAVIVGNALWGIPGMFLSIPLLAIIKLIFDHIEPLKPWGFLFGDTMPAFIKLNRKKRNKKS